MTPHDFILHGVRFLDTSLAEFYFVSRALPRFYHHTTFLCYAFTNLGFDYPWLVSVVVFAADYMFAAELEYSIVFVRRRKDTFYRRPRPRTIP